MRTLGAGLFLTLVLAGNCAFAQRPGTTSGTEEAAQIAPPGVSPEIWAYIQELRRQDDPKLNARRAAQFKTQQRQARLATQQWFGYSNLRPTVNPIPFMSNYSPMWVGNQNLDQNWSAGGFPQPASSVYVQRDYLYR